MDKKRKSRGNKKTKSILSSNAIVIISGIVCAVTVIFVVMSIYFNNHFFIRSTVNGVGTSFKSVEGAYKRVLKCADNYELTFIDENGEKIDTLTSEELGVNVNYSQDDIGKFIEHQNGYLWIAKLFNPDQFYTATGNSYDRVMVEQCAEKVDFVDAADATKSENAKIIFNGKNFEIKPEVYGTLITKQSVVDAIVYAIENFQSEIDVSKGDCCQKPEITADDDRLKTAVKELNEYMDVDIHYDLGEGLSEEIPVETKAGFFKVTDKCRVSFDEDAIGAFVDSMGEKYNTYGKPKELLTSSGEQVSVPCGAYGWRIGYQAEIDAIKKDLKAGKDVTRDFNYLYSANSHGEHDYGDNFVEVNLTDQMVYVHQGGKVVFSSSCVSGNISAGHGTHTGTYPIAYKEKDATLKGANYESHVKYWMPFNMGEGLHDASWRSSFGGHLFMTSGSHGCVNLPTSAAKQIFDIVDAGWPVLVFYVGDTEKDIYAKNNPVSKVETEIANIETVTADSAVQLINARSHYDALSDEQKAQVSNIDVLEAAELQYQMLLVQGQQAEQPEANPEAQQPAVDPAQQSAAPEAQAGIPEAVAQPIEPVVQ